MNSLIFFLAISALFIASAYGTFVEGGLENHDDGFAIFGVFSYYDDPNGGYVGAAEIELFNPVDEGLEVTFVLYDDEDASFPKIFDDDTGSYYPRYSCQDKVAMNKDYERPDMKMTFKNGVITKQFLFKIATRPRFWYVGVAVCDNPEAMKNIKYTAHFINYVCENAAWEGEFGSNVNGLQTMYIIYLFFFSFYAALHFKGVKGLYDKLSYVHPLVKLFSSLVFLEWLSVLCYTIHYGVYAADGVGVMSLYWAADVMNMCALIGFVMMLMLVAKGWTISTESLEGKNTIIGVFAFVLTIDLILLFWEIGVRIPEAVAPPLALQIFQYIFMAFWFGFAAWYKYTVNKSYEEEPDEDKRGFYKNLGIWYTIWIVAIPFTSFFCLIVGAEWPWIAFKTEVAINLTFTTTAAFLSMTYLIWPSHASKYFSVSVPQVSSGSLDYARL